MSWASKLTPHFGSFSEFVISPLFTWLWCGFIVAYAVKWLTALLWQSYRIGSQLKAAAKEAKEIQSSDSMASRMQSFHKTMLSRKKLQRPWMEYYKTLMKFPTPEKGRERAKSTPETYSSVLATREPQEFFNIDSVVNPSIDQRLFSVISTHLSGLGILGTFCGLASGIYLARHGLAGGQMQEIQHGLAQLLSGASLAFWTSIVGIMSSIIFSRIERLTSKKLNRLIGDFNHYIQASIDVVSQEQLSNKHLSQSFQQNVNLEKVIDGLKKLYQERSDANEKVLREISREFHQTMTMSAGQEIKYIATAFKEIHAGLKETKESINNSGKYLLESIDYGSKMFKKNLYEISHQFQGNFHKTNESIQGTFKEASKDISHALNKSSLEMGEAIKKPAAELGDSLKSLNKQIGITSQSLKVSTERNIENTKKVMEVHNRLCEYINPLVNAGHAISKACGQAQSSLGQSAKAASRISEAVKYLEASNKVMMQSWEAYSKRFEGVDQNLNSIFQQTHNNLNRYSEKVKDFTTDLDKHMSKGVMTLAGAVGDLRQTIGVLPESLKMLSKVPNYVQEREKINYPKNRNNV